MPSFLVIAVPLTVIGTGLVYMFALWFVNENNAKTWLSGYNTMSKAEQEKFDLKGYINFFKSFFYYLGVYGTLIYFVLLFMTDEQYAIWIWIAVQLLPLPFLIHKGNQFKNKK
jgi:flagellar biosynthesis protein FlhB